MAYRFQISAKILSWPRACACCLGSPDTKLRAAASRTTGKRVQHTTTSWWDVPYCSHCLTHQSKYDGAGSILGGAFVIALLLWLIVGLSSSSGVAGAIVAVVAIAIGFAIFIQAKESAQGMMTEQCCSPGAAVQYIDWHGTFQTFVFANERYLESFLDSNNRKSRSDIERV